MKEPDKLFSTYVSWRGKNTYRFCPCFKTNPTKTKPEGNTSREMITTRSVLINMVKEIMIALQQEEHEIARKQDKGGGVW